MRSFLKGPSMACGGIGFALHAGMAVLCLACTAFMHDPHIAAPHVHIEYYMVALKQLGCAKLASTVAGLAMKLTSLVLQRAAIRQWLARRLISFRQQTW